MFLRRRDLLISALGAGVSLLPSRAQAAPLTGIDVLDLPAIPVKNPGGVLLVAITRAGGRLVAVGEHGVIVFSDDNGIHWSQAVVPVSVTFTSVAFATPVLGWAAGHSGVIVATSDGGESWHLQLNGIQANRLTLAAAEDPNIQKVPAPGVAFAMRRANFFVQAGPDKPFLSILIFSPQKVMVFGAYRMTMLTLDGGKTWMDWSLHIYDRLSHNIYDAAFVGSSIFLAVEEGLVFRSTDAGGSFLPVASPAPSTLFGIIGADDGSVIAFGVAGSCYRSVDEGKSWTQVSIDTQDNLAAGSKLAPSGEILLAGLSGALYISRDNGKCFVPVSHIPPFSIFDIDQTADGTVVFVGSGGAVSLPLAAIKS